MDLKSEEMMVDDQFLYFVTFQKVWRFNIRCAELIKDFSDCSSPIGMGGMVINSKLYMFGGEKIKKGSDIFATYMMGNRWPMPAEAEGFNEDVFELDPTKQVPLVPVCGDDSIPRMNAPKICPIVATIGDRIYVLSSSQPLYNFTHCLPPQSIFEAYDPSTKSWMELDPPPFYEEPRGSFLGDHFVWGNRLFLRTPLGFFFFDVKDNTWHNTKSKIPITIPGTTFRSWRSTNDADFWPQHHQFPVFAYRFDPSDLLLFKSYIPLVHEFGKVVDPPLHDCSGHINHLGDGDDGRMSLLLSGIEIDSNKKKNWIVRIATFQVHVSQQSADAEEDDDEVLSVLVDDPVTFNLGDVTFEKAMRHDSVFVLCEKSKKRAAENVQGDGRFKKEKYSMI